MLSIYKTIFSKKSQLNSNTYLYHFNLFEPKEIIFKPGQYIILKVPLEKGYIFRLYSISSSNTEKNSFELIVETVLGGLGSGYLSSLKEGVEVNFQGPAGMFSIHENEKEKIFMVTGTGIAPILSMIKSQLQTTNYKLQTYLFWGLKNYKDVYLLNELKGYKLKVASFDFKICLSREQNLDMIPEEDKKYFFLGHIDSCFEKLFTNHYSLITVNEFYLCGGRNIVESLKQFLLSKNVPKENIIFEKF